jgi:Zinc dependent phospholipase C
MTFVAGACVCRRTSWLPQRRPSRRETDNLKLRARKFSRIFVAAVSIAVLVLGSPERSEAYAVLSHEAIIDSLWDTNLKPVLLKRFPNATPDELKTAHGYAYGGAIIQDMGYYPHGSKLVSDLTHYVRSGDFVLALLRDAKDLNGYAFALGALAHYAADNDGHRIGTNMAVPVLYPKLRKKFGPSVTYEDDPLAHVKTEFGFDVIEVAQKRYAPDSYHDFIGFQVSAPLLEQAFQETYGLDLKSVLANEDKALNSYRRDVSTLLPKATRIAWSLKKDEIMKDAPGITKRKFLYNLSRASYEKEWGRGYTQPTFGEKFLAFIVRILPKIGPLKVLEFKTPTPATEKMFEASFNATLDRYRGLLAKQGEGQLTELLNDNFDTGEISGPGKYRLNDAAHAQLMDLLAKQNFASASPEVRAELLDFYSQTDAPYATKSKPKEWARVQTELQQLKTAPPVVPTPAPPTPAASASTPERVPPAPPSANPQ